ncbi:MAG: hypothetical protein IJK15_00275 [Bacteroidaceae bacterium]|nr:hypothetical protein [Bacteroidaceae bacterium]
MKKYIDIKDAITVMAKLQSSKRVEGVLYVDGNTGRLTFKAYNRQNRNRERDRLVRKLPWGWVKESIERIKVHASLPKEVGTADMMWLLDEHTRDAKNALIEREMDKVVS